MSKKGLKTMLVCIVLLIGLVTLFACNKSDVADKDGQTKVIVKIQNEDGSIYKENVVFSDLFTLSLQKEGYTGRLYRDADFLKPLTKDSKVKNGDTVYVKWTINKYTVTFMDGETTLKTEMVKHGFAATPPNVFDTATKKFVRWDKPFDNVTSDLIVNAKFETKKFTLTFINFDGTTVDTAEVEYGAPIDSHFETADSAAATTYDTTILDYVGWYKADGTEITKLDLPTMPAENVTLTLKLRLMDSAIGDFKVNTPADFTYDENKSAVFTVNGTPYPGVTYKYIWTINKDNVIYKTEETTESSLTLQNLAAGKYFAKVRIVASKEGCGSVDNKDKPIESSVLTVSRAKILGIKVTGGTFTYGDENAKIKIDGLKDGDKVFYGKDGVSFSSEIVDFSKCDVGEYKYSVKVVRNENFNEFTSDVVTINVTKAAVTIRFTPDKNELVYGDELPALSAYVGETKIGTVDKGNYFLKLGEIAFSEKAVNVGEYAVEVKGFTNDYYNDKNFDVTFLSSDKITISRAKLVVKTLAAEDVVYGDDLSEVGCEITGWKNGDEKTEYTLVPTTEYNKKSSVGPYSFSYGISGERIKYYDTETNVVSFNVTKRAAEIIINDVKDIVYGDKVPELSAIVNGLLDGDTLLYTLKTDYTEKAEPKEKEYSVFAEIDGEENANYEVSFKGKSFNVLKKSLTITLESLRVAAGKEYKKNAEELKIDGLVSGDTVTGYVTITKDEAGDYTSDDFDKRHLVFKENCYDATYDLKVEFVKVDFKIHFADEEVGYNGQNHSVAVTADDGTNYTITYGTKKGIYDLTAAPSYKNAGVYVTYFKVVDNSLDDGSEYEDEIKLTVKKAEVEIKIGTYTMAYGDELPEFSYVATGLIEGDVLSGEARYSVDGITGGNVGTYDINVSGLFAGDNYTIIVVSGTLTINKKNVDVVWSVKDRYVFSPDGQEMPTATYDGISAKVTTNGEFKNAGTYTFTATDDSGNYTLTNAVLNVVIEKATYSGIVHAALSGVYNPAKTLKDYALAEGFTWVDASEKPVCTKPEYAAIYNADSDNYENFELNIAIDLQKAKVALKDGVVGFDYDGTSHEVKAAVTYNGVALDTSLYSLTYDGKTSKTYTDAGTHACLIEISADNYALPENTYLYVKVKGVKVGNNYYTIEDALFKSKSGDTVEFISAAKEVSFAPLDIATAIYADNAYRTVKAGVTLKLASDEDSSAKIGKPTYGNGVGNYVDTDSSKIKYKLILNESTVLEVYGNILIQGLLGVNGPGLSGHTSGNHSQIINNGTINLNSGANLDLRGYIKGAGTIEARSGAIVYSPFVVYDYRGGTNTATVYRKGNIAPFRIYEMPNIQCNYSILYEAEHKGYLDLYASDQHRTAVATIFGKGSAMIIMEDSTAHITTTYERTGNLIGETTLTMTGKVKMGVLKIKVTTTVTVAMNEVRFPMPWNFTINVGDGLNPTTFTLPDDYKMMTGATVNIKKSATVNLTGTLLIYKSFTDTPFGGTVYPNKGAAKLNVEGVVNAIGGIAGEVHGINGGKVIIGNKAILSITEKEGNSGSTKSWQALVGAGEFVTVATISEVAKVVNADNSTVAAETNKTYNYNNGTWQ